MYENIKPLKVNIISDIHYYSREMGYEGKAFDKTNATASNEMVYSKEILEALMNQLANSDSDIVLDLFSADILQIIELFDQRIIAVLGIEHLFCLCHWCFSFDI